MGYPLTKLRISEKIFLERRKRDSKCFGTEEKGRGNTFPPITTEKRGIKKHPHVHSLPSVRKRKISTTGKKEEKVAFMHHERKSSPGQCRSRSPKGTTFQRKGGGKKSIRNGCPPRGRGGRETPPPLHQRKKKEFVPLQRRKGGRMIGEGRGKGTSHPLP